MKWIDRLFLPLRPVRLCPECATGISHKARYCEHCGAWLAKSTWLPEGGFNWGLVSEILADLLTEPTVEYPAKVQACRAILASTGKGARLIAGFEERIRRLSTEELRKVYRDTFDLTPSCSLEVGKQLYPSDEDERDKFVAWMRQDLRSKNVKSTPYSPDNLVLCLRAIARMNSAGAEDFASGVLPAVSRIAAAMRVTNNPFENLLTTVEWMLTPS